MFQLVSMIDLKTKIDDLYVKPVVFKKLSNAVDNEVGKNTKFHTKDKRKKFR